MFNWSCKENCTYLNDDMGHLYKWVAAEWPQSDRVTESQTPKGTQYMGGWNFFVPEISINSPTRFPCKGIISWKLLPNNFSMKFLSYFLLIFKSPNNPVFCPCVIDFRLSVGWERGGFYFFYFVRKYVPDGITSWLFVPNLCQENEVFWTAVSSY